MMKPELDAVHRFITISFNSHYRQRNSHWKAFYEVIE